MRILALRRSSLMTITVLIAVTLSIVFTARWANLREIGRTSGWILLGSILFLAAYNLRKRISLFPALLPAAWWLQVHIYVGLLTVVVFGWHLGMRLPRGPLETTLALAYAATVVSGVLGLAACRWIPIRMAIRGSPVLHERIPMFRRQVRMEVEELILKTVQEARATTLADFYRAELVGFLAGPRNRWLHLVQSPRPLRRVLAKIDTADRYLNEGERAALPVIRELVRAKDTLDYHRAMQGVLRAWLFVHIPLTYVLLLLAAVHVLAVRAFSGAS